LRRRYQWMLRAARLLAPPHHRRPIHLNARIGKLSINNEHTWYHDYRARAIAAAQSLPPSIITTPTNAIRRSRFTLELMRSRLAFSPFGWGEVCYRDIEAAAAGAVLLKPDMSHLACAPDLYEPNETYIPLRWDNSDLEEKASRLLENPAEAARIATNLQNRLADFILADGFIETVARALLAPLPTPAPATTPAPTAPVSA
ncbi:MAG: glycosyltransferase, partial [Planctomycetota bacterium]|nr:glycosyltransferase [Planctomycetota bacterium]